MRELEFAITAIGMATAVGWDAATSCASFRAGISRAEDLDYAAFYSEEEGELLPVSGHLAADRAVECEGLGKMIGIGVDALRDLVGNREPLARAEQARTGFYLALPNYSLRQETFVDVNAVTLAGLPTEESLLAEPDDEADPFMSLRFAAECNRYLPERLLNVAGVKVNVVLSANIYGHHTGLFLCLQHAARALRSGQVDRCIVGGIDSLVEIDTLEWALIQGRLKSPSAPCGFSPGEAAVFLEVVRADSVSSGSPVSAYLTEPSVFGRVGHSKDSQNPGAELAKAIRSTLSQAAMPGVGLAIGDLNGEYRRAVEWGYAVNRLMPKYPCFQNVPCWHPAEAFGETGCASAGLGVGAGIEAFRRNYALTDSILVWCSSEDGLKGAVVLSSPR